MTRIYNCTENNEPLSAQAIRNSKGGCLMYENDYSQQQEQELRIKNKVQADFEDEMHEMLMDLRFFIC